MEERILNDHNKQEYPTMHTAEHLVNGEIARRYGCGRAFSARSAFPAHAIRTAPSASSSS